jgi:hypothetical protein
VCFTSKIGISKAIVPSSAWCEDTGSIDQLAGYILKSIFVPGKTVESIHTLAGVSFGQSLINGMRFVAKHPAPALAMDAPLIHRGLASGKSSAARKTIVILDSTSNLVNDPLDSATFLEKLMIALTKAAEIFSGPGSRETAVAQLERLKREFVQALTRQQQVDMNLLFTGFKKMVKDGVKPGLFLFANDFRK